MVCAVLLCANTLVMHVCLEQQQIIKTHKKVHAPLLETTASSSCVWPQVAVCANHKNLDIDIATTQTPVLNNQFQGS